jgi:hypothetical protein
MPGGPVVRVEVQTTVYTGNATTETNRQNIEMQAQGATMVLRFPMRSKPKRSLPMSASGKSSMSSVR